MDIDLFPKLVEALNARYRDRLNAVGNLQLDETFATKAAALVGEIKSLKYCGEIIDGLNSPPPPQEKNEGSDVVS